MDSLREDYHEIYDDYTTIMKDVANNIDKVVMFKPCGDYLGYTLLHKVSLAEYCYDNLQDIDRDAFVIYEDYYDKMWKVLEGSPPSEIIEVMKYIEKDLRKKFSCPPSCGIPMTQPYRSIVCRLGQSISFSVVSELGEKHGIGRDDAIDAHANDIKKYYNDFLDGVLDIIELMGPKARKLADILSEDTFTTRVINSTVRAKSVGPNEIEIEIDNVKAYVYVGHPEVDEVFRRSRMEYLDKKNEVKQAVKSVKNQIMSML